MKATEKLKQQMRENYKKNKQKYIDRANIWRKNNPEKIKIKNKIYNDAHKGNNWKRLKKIRNEIIVSKGSKCAMCGYNKLPALQLHHLYGKDCRTDYFRKGYDSNKLILVCANCHCLIHDKKRGEI